VPDLKNIAKNKLYNAFDLALNKANMTPDEIVKYLKSIGCYLVREKENN